MSSDLPPAGGPQVRLKLGREVLRRLFQQQLSRGGLRVRAAKAHAVGSTIRVELAREDGTTFLLDATVLGTVGGVSDGRPPSLKLKLIGLDADKLAALRAFADVPPEAPQLGGTLASLHDHPRPTAGALAADAQATPAPPAPPAPPVQAQPAQPQPPEPAPAQATADASGEPETPFAEASEPAGGPPAAVAAPGAAFEALAAAGAASPPEGASGAGWTPFADEPSPLTGDDPAGEGQQNAPAAAGAPTPPPAGPLKIPPGTRRPRPLTPLPEAPDGMSLPHAAPLEPDGQDAEPSGDPRVGTVIVGRYTLMEKLGAGGMGTVYKARQFPLDRVVAIKFLHLAMAGDENAVKRFHREAQSLSKLSHPNTITVFDYGQAEDGALFLVMEYLPGQDLKEVIEQRDHLTVPTTISYISQVCASLAEAHDSGVIHRDLKPGNVRITEVGGRSDFVKLMDFGLIKSFDRTGSGGEALTDADVLVGTPEFMSPDQLRNQDLDQRSDIYSLGCIMYQMLSGKAPFEATSIAALLWSHMQTPPTPFAERRPDLNVPADLERIVFKALAKDREDRYQTVYELLADLAVLGRKHGVHVDEGGSVSSSSLSRSRAPARGGAGRKALYILAPIVALLLLAVGYVGVFGPPWRAGGEQGGGAPTTPPDGRSTGGSKGPASGGTAPSAPQPKPESPPPQPKPAPAAPRADAGPPAKPDLAVAKPAPPKPRHGTIVIATRFEGRSFWASVKLDGRARGESPTTLRRVKPGRHTVSISRPGYKPASKTVRLRAGQRKRLVFEMKKQ